MQPNDYIIIIEDETPQQRVARTGERFSKRRHPTREQLVGYPDVVASVSNGNVRLKTHKDAEFNSTGKETPSSRARRASQGKPTRRAYFCPQEVFQLPRGLQCTISWASIDTRTVDAIKAYHDAKMQGRENARRDHT